MILLNEEHYDGEGLMSRTVRAREATVKNLCESHWVSFAIGRSIYIYTVCIRSVILYGSELGPLAQRLK